MAVAFKVIGFKLALLLAQFLFGNSYLLLPASPDCCSDDLYPRLALLTGLLLLTTLAAAAVLLSALSYAHAYKKGDASKRGWKLRAQLLLGIGLCAASTFIAFPTFKTGYGYRNGCVYSCCDSVITVLMVILAFYHAGAAWLVVVAQDQTPPAPAAAS